jgi:hypothetical protein
LYIDSSVGLSATLAMAVRGKVVLILAMETVTASGDSLTRSPVIFRPSLSVTTTCLAQAALPTISTAAATHTDIRHNRLVIMDRSPDRSRSKTLQTSHAL